MPQQNSIPKKIRAFAFILTLIGIGAGISGYIKPDIIVPGFMPDTVGAQTIAMMFAGRNLALGIAMLFILFWGTPEQFVLLFGVRFMIELVDILAEIAVAPSFAAALPMTAVLSVFLILEAAVVAAMWKASGKRAGEMR